MDSKLYYILNRFSLASDRAIGRRLYCHASRQAKTRRLYAYPDTNIEPELDCSVRQNKKLRMRELKSELRTLREEKRFTEALEVSERMNETGICEFSPREHAVHLDLIGRVRGFSAVGHYFCSLPEQNKNDETYGALLNCYVRQHQTEKETKIKEMDFSSSSLTYNDIMFLYTNTDQLEKVPEVLAEMKKNKVSPDNYSYKICINSFGLRSDLEGMEKMLKEMDTQPHIAMDWNTYAVAANFYAKAGLADKAIDALKKAEVMLEKKDGTGFNFLISVYAKLGKKDEVLRLWELEKTACERCINRDYMYVLESLVKLGEFSEAKKIVTEWVASCNRYDLHIPNILILGYCEKALFDEADAMLKALKKEGKPICHDNWERLAAGYLDNGQMMQAFECTKAGVYSPMEKSLVMPPEDIQFMWMFLDRCAFLKGVDPIKKCLWDYKWLCEGYHYFPFLPGNLSHGFAISPS